GHRYFTLVEKKEGTNEIVASLKAVAWKFGSSRIREFEKQTGQAFGNNINVLLNVSVSYHQRYGLQLMVNDISAAFTIGKLEMERQATLQRLLVECPGLVRQEGENLISLNNSLPLNMVIRRIALVGSSASAGYEDFLHTLEQNEFGYRFAVDSYLGTVQGEANAAYLAATFAKIAGSNKFYDAVVLVRGGGADTDFLLFDQYELCRQVAGFPIPIITGLGHLKNHSITDRLAHTALKTPTKAAEFILAHNRASEDRLKALRNTLIIKSLELMARRQRELALPLHAIIHHSQQAFLSRKDEYHHLSREVLSKSKALLNRRSSGLAAVATHLSLAPLRILSAEVSALQQTQHTLRRDAGRQLKDQIAEVSSMERLFRLMSPMNILKKGFALVSAKGYISRDGSDVEPGQEISIRLSAYEITAITIQKEKRDGDEFNL
ncbi:MAG TPA: exodeoxyribonuclease VII large subunit, partial [Flavisolibacter sp.]|nr:exodeoxyribonuclease VII large subunit [Flavisolibacter sp.]